MKKIISAVPLFFCGALLFAQLSVPFFGNNNFTIDADTTLAADLNNGASGLLTNMGVGLWFEFTPYSDRNITPQRDVLSVSLKLANSAFYSWRGYEEFINSTDGAILPSLYGGMNLDQAKSIWFNTFIAQLEYNSRYWIRVAGIEPEITLSQASIKSVFDPVFNNRTDVAKNPLFMPLFHAGGHYNGKGGVTSLIGRDLVHLNRREVAIAGNISAGITGETLDLTLKGGSWKTAKENADNSWVGGGDLVWRPDLATIINFSLLTAVNYGTVTPKGGVSNLETVDDPEADKNALVENPLALGLGYEYRLNLPGRMVMKPYAGIDFIYETKAGEYNLEAGAGLQLFFRGANAGYKRNDKIGGVAIGDVDLPAAFVFGINVDKNGLCNAIVSFNESPRDSVLPNLGGYLELELMNIGGKEYMAPDGINYNNFYWAGIVQLEYLINKKVMPYVFGRYMPAIMPDDPTESPVFSKDHASITSKLGCRFMPIDYFFVDFWYERTDLRRSGEWDFEKGLFSLTFGLKNYL